MIAWNTGHWQHRVVAMKLLIGIAACMGTSEPTREAAMPSDWTRFGWDAGRSNAPTGPSGITAANVASLRKQQVAIDGTADASPIYLHGVRVNGGTHDVFFVTTTYGKTLAIDAADGSVLWRFTPPGYDTWAGTYRITTATPVADPGREFVYAASPDGQVQKLAVEDGHVVWRTVITKLPQREKIASPLNFFRGRVIAATGGYIGDAPPYQGHVAIIDGASGGMLHVWNSLCSDRSGLLDPASCAESGSAIWGRAAVVIDTVSGDLFVATGNGRWDGRTNWGDAVIELDPDATAIAGNYTPPNTAVLNATDADLGSTAPVLLGGGFIAQGGKDSQIRLLGVANVRGVSPHSGGELQMLSTPSGVDRFTAPAVLHSATETWMFTADQAGTAAWALTGGRLAVRWQNTHAGTSPIVVAGLLYAYDPGGGLRVYDANTGLAIAVLDCGGGHWNSPIVVDGRIALPEGNANDHRTSGVLDIWRATP
jgi:outer membrane protein assembly factor BamB